MVGLRYHPHTNHDRRSIPSLLGLLTRGGARNMVQPPGTPIVTPRWDPTFVDLVSVDLRRDV
jgi:hypothetical protein